MKITIKVFAGVKDACGFEEKELSLDPGCTVDRAVTILADQYPALLEIRDSLLFAVNEEYAEGTRRLLENDTLALFPPVSGG